MSLTIERERLRPEDAESAAACVERAAQLGRLVRLKAVGLAFLACGLVALGALALAAPKLVCPVGAAALLLAGVLAWLLVTLQGELLARRAVAEAAEAVEQACRRGEVELLRLAPDAAWRVPALDERLPAVLLRCGAQFVYLNLPIERLLDERVGRRDGDRDGNGGASHGHAGSGHIRRISAIRRWPAPVLQVLEVVAGDGWLPLGELRGSTTHAGPSTEDAPEVQIRRCLAGRPDWNAAVLEAGELPDGWRMAVA